MQNKSFSKRRILARSIAALFVGGAFLAPGIAPEAHAQLTWDANGTGAGQTDGAGVWLTANQWWNGAANATWTSGSNAVFGNGGAGGAVTLASATTVGSLTFNSFTGTYTLGTAANTITLNSGIIKNAGGAAATIISPITLGAAQSWTNNSTGLLTVGTGAVTNGGFLLTVGGTGNTTISSVVGGTGGMVKSGAGTLILSGVNTYTGATTVSAGTVTLSGARTAAATNGFNVGNLAGSTGTLNVSAGTFTVGTAGSNFLVGNAAGATGIMNQSGGTLTTIGNQLLIGNSGGTGTYNLSAGTLTTIAGSLGVTVGVNTGSTATFNLSGGTLSMPATSTLQITRSDNSAATGVTGTFAQTGGTATVGILQMGGSNTTPANNANANATLNLSAGTFNATTFNQLSGANNSISTINISGTADVTLPAFPTARGTGATATISFDGGTLRPRAASATYMGGLTNAFIKAGGARFNTANGSITVSQSLLTDGVSLGGGLTKDGTNSLTLAGANTFTGATNVNAGTLALDYSSQDNSKLSDTTALTLNGVTVDLVGGAHSETVGSTTLTANTASSVTRSSGGATINLNTITNGTGAAINFGASNIATTDNLNNASGILGFWATVGGSDWAANSTNAADGLITAYSGNIDVQRLTPGTIADGSATNVRLIEGSGSAGNITLGAATTTINSLNQSAQGGGSAATIDPAGQTLATNAILVGTGAGSLTIGTGVNNGFVSAGTAGGDLTLINNTANGLTINSVIADNTSASTLTKMGTGTATLAGASTYTGATTIYAGTLQLSGGTNRLPTATSVSLANIAGAILDVNGQAQTIAGLTGGGTTGGNVALGAAGALTVSNTSPNTYAGVISGATGTLTMSGSSTLTLTGTNTHGGGTTISPGGTLIAPVAGSLGVGNVTNNGTLNLTGGALTYTGLSNTTPGALGGNGVVNVTLGTGSGTTALNGNYSNFTGTWNVGIGAAAGAGKVQMNGADNAAATVNLLTNATLFSNGAGIVHNPAIILNGGDTGESIGQLRLESGATWAGPVTLAGNITGTGDGFFGNNTAGNIGTISGNIGETGGSRTLSKVGAGTIVLTGTNTYTGPTTIGAGVLVAQGSVGAALPTTSPVNLGAATLQILNDAAGTIAQSNNITLTGGVTAGIAVGNAGGGTTGSTVAFGALNNGTTANAFNSTIGFTGANGYLQSFASLALSGSTGQNTTLNPTTTSVTILGNVTNQMTGYGAGNFDTLTLGGTSTGNAINGIISDAATGTPAVNSGDTRIAKSGTSTWTLNGPNTYIGTTTITGGVLRITNGLALGSTTSGTTQSGTSALEIDGTGGPVIVGAEALSINGGGITNLGALRNIAGNNTYGGTVTLAAQSRINSDSGTLTLSNATAVTGAAQNLVIGGAGNITISGAITTTTGFVSRDGTGTLTLGGANTYTGLTSAAAGTISLTGSIASSNISTSGTGVFSQSGTGSIGGTGTFIQGSSGTSTLAGTNTFTGATSVNAGMLVLDYTTQDNTKLSDTAALTLGNATLDLKGGTHNEVVLSTTLTANTASSVTSSVLGSVLQMGAITRNAGAAINFGASNIATTSNINTNGILGTWATVGGVDWATNSADPAAGLITAYTGYTDVQRLTPGTIADGSATNVRLIEGSGSAGNILLGAATTTINTLNQSALGGNSSATIDPAGQTLATSGILIGSGAGALTIGTGVNNGTVTAATAGGDLALVNNTANALTINSSIANNTSASTLTKLGTGNAILTGINTYSGATTIGLGTLTIAGAGQLGSGTYAGAISTGPGSTLAYSSSADQTLSGVISGAGSLIKDTSSTSNLSLTAANTYTGNTTVNSGTLTLAGATGVGTAGGYLYNGLTGTATVTVASGAQIVISSNNPAHNALGYGASHSWVVGGTVNSTGGDAHTMPGSVTLNNGTLTGVANATFGTYITNAGYTTTLTANGASNTISSANFGMAGTLVLNTPLATDALSVSPGLGVTGQVAGGLTKTGLGTATLSGASTYTGTTTVTAGTLTVTGSTNQGTTTSDVLIANTATGNAVLKIQGPMTARYLSTGGVTGASGAVYMTTGGSFTGGADIELGFTFGAGTTTGGYGYYGMDGGTVNINRFQFGGQNVAAQNGVGVGLITGGTVNAGGYVILSRYGTTPGTIGTLTVATGGTLNHTSATAGQNLALGWQGAGRAELNLTGGTITSATGRSVAYGGGGATWTGTGIVNLNAGTLTTTSFTVQGTGATSYLNFNGGTLKAVSTQSAFLPAVTGAYVNGAFGSFNGGAVFDSNGVNITVAAALIAPTGNGVATIPVTNGGSGYIGAPAVSITDGGAGFGATAIANMVDDGTGNGTFKIGSITITNPGNNYTAPAVSLVGGGNGVTPATIGTLTSAANTSGGLTKNGAGSLILGGTNTYTGGTSVNTGTVQITNASALGTGNVNVAAGAQVFVNANNLTVANNFTLNGITTNGAIYSGDRPAGNVTNLTGMITLNADSNMSHWWNDKTLQLSGKITGAGGLSLDLQPGAVGGRYLISGSTNDYLGATTVTGLATPQFGYTGQAMLYLGANNALPTTTNLTLNNADLYLNGQSQTLPAISGTGTFSVQNGSTTPATLSLGSGNATSTFAGTILDNGLSVTNTVAAGTPVTGTVALTKIGNGILSLTGNNTYTGGTTISAGTLQVGDGGATGSVGSGPVINNAGFVVNRTGTLITGTIDGTGTTTVTATGANLTAARVRQATLDIGAGNTVTVASNGGNSGTSTVTNLNINATGKLDLTNNDLIVDNGNLATLTSKLASGLDINGSYGNGPGITSSAFATNPNFNTVLGIAANVELGYTSFSGQTVDANDILIKYTYYGDADLSGSVDTSTDFDLYITGLTSGGSLGGWLFGDFDYSGTVDSSTDFDLYITGLTTQGGALLTAGGGGNLVQAVPEPSTFVLGGLALLGFAGVGLRRRRLAKQQA